MTQDKIIKVNNCLECPMVTTCTRWSSLTAKQRFAIKCGNNIKVGILKGCPLDDLPEDTERMLALQKMVAAVHNSEFDGVTFHDVDGENWFDMRESLGLKPVRTGT